MGIQLYIAEKIRKTGLMTRVNLLKIPIHSAVIAVEKPSKWAKGIILVLKNVILIFVVHVLQIQKVTSSWNKRDYLHTILLEELDVTFANVI